MNMKYITVTTPENVEIEYRLAGLGSRMAAALIDFCVIGLAVLLIAAALFFAVFGGEPRLVGARGLHGWAAGAALLSVFVVFFGYFIISECSMKGQSLGKKILKLRVIRQNGSPVTFFPSLVRNLFRYCLDMFGVGAACMFFHGQHKRPGDMAAGTVVVSENPGRIQPRELSSPAPPSHTVMTDARYAVSGAELALLEEYFSRKEAFLDGGQPLQEKLIAYFAKKFHIADGKLDEAGLEKIMALNRRVARL